MKAALEILKEYHNGKIYDLYIYTTPHGRISDYLQTTNHCIAPARVEPIRLTVNDVIKSEYSYFYLTFNETDKILLL